MDIQKFFDNVARIADALDRLAEMKEHGKIVLPTVQLGANLKISPYEPKDAISIKVPEGTVVEPDGSLTVPAAPTPGVVPAAEPPAAPAQEPATTVDDKARRDFLKAELTRLGVKFAPTARTSTLETMLRGAAKREEPKTDLAAPVVESLTEVTKDDAKVALIALSEKRGKEKAFELMDKIGGSRKLSDWDPKHYGPLVVACQKEM